MVLNAGQLWLEILQQPVIKRLNHSIRGDLINAGRIDECGIFLEMIVEILKNRSKFGEIL